MLISILFMPCLITMNASFFTIKLWAKGCLVLLNLFHNLKIEYIQDTPISQTGNIVASKHQSMLEILGLIEIVPRPIFFMKASLLFVPFLNLYLLRTGQLFVWRGYKNNSHLLEKAKQKLESANIIIFPEGTRSTPGIDSVYKKGVIFLAKIAFKDNPNIKLIPISINTGYFWGRRSVYKKPGIAKIHVLSPLNIKETNIDSLKEIIEIGCKKL